MTFLQSSALSPFFPWICQHSLLKTVRRSIQDAHIRQMKLFPEQYRFALGVALICVFWFAISSTGGILNKIVLDNYPYPMTVALCSLISISFWSLPVMSFWQIGASNISTGYLLRFVLPIAFGKAVAVSSAYFSLWKVPVSYAHTVKATMPLFAVFCARVLLGERQSFGVYLSLLPITMGVVIASATELNFNALGLLSALMSTFTYALLNVLVKKVLKDTNMHPIRLLSLNAQMAVFIFLPVWVYNDFNLLWASEHANHHSSAARDKLLPGAPGIHFLWLLLCSGFLSFAQNLCAFLLIHRLTALSYAVANASKRITVIFSSLITLKNPVTSVNLVGMMLAISGVFIYNRAKQSLKERVHQLPLTRTHATLSDAALVVMDGEDDDDEANSTNESGLYNMYSDGRGSSIGLKRKLINRQHRQPLTDIVISPATGASSRDDSNHHRARFLIGEDGEGARLPLISPDSQADENRPSVIGFGHVRHI